jgi:4-amino-4-deoxy-L-arabinose transferase-like glycosyltransferase
VKNRSASIRRLHWVAVCLASLLYYALVVHGVRGKSGTADEFIHVTGGFSYWAFDDYRLHPENGNWSQRLVSLPAVLGNVAFPTLDQEAWRRSIVAELGDQLFFGPGVDSDAMLIAARRIVAVVGVLLGILVFQWSRSIYGFGGAWVSLIVFMFTPAVLANSGLATSDIIATTFFLAAVLALWRVLHRTTPLAVAASVLACGGLFLSKFSALIFIPIAVSMVVVRMLGARPLEVSIGPNRTVAGARRLPWFTGLTLVHAAGVVLIIWASFGFRYSAFSAGLTGSERFIDPWNEIVDSSLVGRSVQWARTHEVLPEAYLYGLGTVSAYSKHRSAFLNGQVQPGGWRWYFPYAALVKTTLPALLLVATFVVVIMRRLMRRGGDADADDFDPYDLIPLTLLVGWYWAFAVASHLNIGHRHLLPASAAMTVMLGAVAGPLSRLKTSFGWLPMGRPGTYFPKDAAPRRGRLQGQPKGILPLGR